MPTVRRPRPGRIRQRATRARAAHDRSGRARAQVSAAVVSGAAADPYRAGRADSAGRKQSESMKHDLMAANVALHRRRWATDFVKTCRALGMTDDEIRTALIASQTPTVTTAPAASAPLPQDQATS
jgi:hypothetical protein